MIEDYEGLERALKLKKEYEKLLREHPDAIKFYDSNWNEIDISWIDMFDSENNASSLIEYFIVKNPIIAKRIVDIIEQYVDEELDFKMWKVIQYLSIFRLDEGLYSYTDDAEDGHFYNVLNTLKESITLLEEAKEHTGNSWGWK